MKLNLKRNELEGLHLLLTESLQFIKPVTIADKLVHELADSLNERIRKKMHRIQYYGNTNYGIKLNSIEAYALYVYCQHLDQSIKEMYAYESMVAHRVVMAIDQECA